MAQKAAKELFEAVQKNYYEFSDLKDLNYSEICEWCGCNYYLGYGSRNAQHCLWAHDEQKQIDKMRELYDLLPVKPEWLTREQIDEYAARMNVK